MKKIYTITDIFDTNFTLKHETAHYGKSSISIFKESFAGIEKN